MRHCGDPHAAESRNRSTRRSKPPGRVVVAFAPLHVEVQGRLPRLALQPWSNPGTPKKESSSTVRLADSAACAEVTILGIMASCRSSLMAAE